jgi:hypothetical protein
MCASNDDSSQKSLTAIQALKGLGKELWVDTNSDQWVKMLRDEWQ